MWCELEPASGSVIAKIIFVPPSASLLSHSCCCAADPCRRSTSTLIALDTSRSQQRAPGCRGFLGDHGQFGHPGAPAAEFGRHVDADEAGLAEVAPQSRHRGAGAAVLGVLGGAVGEGDLPDRGAEIGVLGRFGEVRHGLSRMPDVNDG